MPLSLVLAPDPRLAVVCQPVREPSRALEQQVAEMYRLMWNARGIGLAAPQVGCENQVVVMDIPGDRARVLFNPVWTLLPDILPVPMPEGCLSFPGQSRWVKRFPMIEVIYRDRFWIERQSRLSGLRAQCVQHEVDHLRGILFTTKGESESPATREG